MSTWERNLQWPGGRGLGVGLLREHTAALAPEDLRVLRAALLLPSWPQPMAHGPPPQHHGPGHRAGAQGHLGPGCPHGTSRHCKCSPHGASTPTHSLNLSHLRTPTSCPLPRHTCWDRGNVTDESKWHLMT